MAQPDHLRSRVELMRALGIVRLVEGPLSIELGPAPEPTPVAPPDPPVVAPPEDDADLDRLSCGVRVTVRERDA